MNRQILKEEYNKVSNICMKTFRRAKALNELGLAREVKSSRKIFGFIWMKKKNEAVDLLYV